MERTRRVYVNFEETEDLELGRDIARCLTDQGHVSLVVGGAVLASLLGKKVNDIDKVTTAPYQVLVDLPIDATKVPTGEQYGTMTYVRGEAKVEVTVCRSDFGDTLSTDNRKEVFPTFIHDPAEGPRIDAQRRDLTMNGLMANIFTGRVIDYVGGLKDIEDRKVRHVYPNSFIDDPLRVLRAVLASARYGFGMDPSVFDAINHEAVRRRLSCLSAERVRDTFLKICSLPDSAEVARAMTLLHEFGVLDIWLPELTKMIGVKQNVYHSHDVWGHTLLAVEQSDPDLYCRLFALFHDLGKPATQEWVAEDYGYSFHNHPAISGDIFDQIAKRLKFGKTKSGEFELDINILKHMIVHHMDAFIDGRMSRVIKRLGIDQYGTKMLDLSWRAGRADFNGRGPKWGNQEKLRLADEKLKGVYDKVAAYIQDIQNPVFTTRDLAISGKDVMQQLNMQPGKQVGEVLSHLLLAVQDGWAMNEREDLLIELYWYWREN